MFYNPYNVVKVKLVYPLTILVTVSIIALFITACGSRNEIEYNKVHNYITRTNGGSIRRISIECDTLSYVYELKENLKGLDTLYILNRNPRYKTYIITKSAITNTDDLFFIEPDKKYRIIHHSNGDAADGIIEITSDNNCKIIDVKKIQE